MRVCQPVSLRSSVSGKNVPLKVSVLGYMLKKVSMMFIYLVTLKNFFCHFLLSTKANTHFKSMKYDLLLKLFIYSCHCVVYTDMQMLISFLFFLSFPFIAVYMKIN